MMLATSVVDCWDVVAALVCVGWNVMDVVAVAAVAAVCWRDVFRVGFVLGACWILGWVRVGSCWCRGIVVFGFVLVADWCPDWCRVGDVCRVSLGDWGWVVRGLRRVINVIVSAWLMPKLRNHLASAHKTADCR